MTTNALDNKTMNDWLRQAAGHAPQTQQAAPRAPATANAGAGTSAAPLPTPPTVNDWLRAEAGFDTGRIYK